ncbi:MAG: mechanosensitive ion channel, partial [Acidobacteriota bacterium]|nr:mechanosensitive ion channel [Acidobacteriota bacterium]
PITVGSVVVATVLIAVGYFVSRAVSQLATRLLGRRVALEPGAANALESLSFYAMFVAFVFISLNLVSFPLTIFTIAGGAVAIGVGFGSQNVMNNFISGLILLFERPIRAGDLVGVEGTYGVVEHIGGRSTRIRTPDNTQMIVPNSLLIENSLVNFTLSDDILRTRVMVGVAYGSPVRTVERLLYQALREHPAVLDDREPRVLFTDFGDNALTFEALFWLRARTVLERRTVESDLRFRIDELFRDAQVVIAFPQRDVHLDTLRPLDVRLVAERTAAPAMAEEAPGSRP